MVVKITKPVQGGTIRAIASKSEAHRLLICSALSENETFLSCPERSEDIDATVRCLTAIGASIEYRTDKTNETATNGFYIKPVDLHGNEVQNNKYIILDCGESGATLRFLLPVYGALGLPVSFTMAGRLPSRPLTGLYEEMTNHGNLISKPGTSPLTCEGQLTSGTYTIPGDISSQFISGLLLALPLLHGDSTIRVTGILESRPYVDITLGALRLFGIKINEENENIFNIPGGQLYRSPGTIEVGGDWSNAAFWLSAGAIGQGGITCTGLDLKSGQGDKQITGFLERFGAYITCGNNSVTVSPGKLSGIEIDAGDTPDLVPVLAAVASVAEGKTVIRNAGRLRIKESDRLHTVTKTLLAFGADIKETDDGLIITGRKSLTGGEIESFGDHRIAMTAAVISKVCTGDVLIRDAGAVRKSYPGFFDDFSNILGGAWEEIV